VKIWDISRTLSNDLAPWPGDTPFHFQLAAKIGENAVVNIGAMHMSVHNGSHADARFHFEEEGWKIEQAGLETYLGPAVVVDVTQALADSRGEVITINQLNGSVDQLRQTSRLLLKTGAWLESTIFPKRIPVIDADVADWLQAHGVKLIGLDLPSVDSIDAKVLANHHALARNGISIIESLDLSGVDAGVYGLAALPLKIAGGDAAPVRAILWRDE
jgi:arylformamidase